MAGVGARAGAGFVLSKSGVDAAEYAAEVLGTLRGLAAKVGQTLSYVDGLVPEAQRESYERALSKLRDKAPRSSSSAISGLSCHSRRTPACHPVANRRAASRRRPAADSPDRWRDLRTM